MKKVIPFSNGSEAMEWMNYNCDNCKTSRGCSAKKNIELGFITGDITVKAAQFIGIALKDNNSNRIHLERICENKDKRIIKIYKKKV